MKKEVLLAIVLGFSIGLLITFAIYYTQRLYKRPTTAHSQSQQVDNQLATPTPTPAHQVTITSPTTYELLGNEMVLMTGITSPLSYISAVTNESQVVSQASETGAFEMSIDVPVGATIITVTAINDQGNAVTQPIAVTYLELDEPVATSSNTPTR